MLAFDPHDEKQADAYDELIGAIDNAMVVPGIHITIAHKDVNPC